MSYSIVLSDPVTGEALHAKTPHTMRGGMYVQNGTTELYLTITYNYGKFYYEVYPEEGIRSIYGKSGADSISYLEQLIAGIKQRYPELPVSTDYWTSCAGNALRPLYQLLAMAKMRPDGVWDGD